MIAENCKLFSSCLFFVRFCRTCMLTVLSHYLEGAAPSGQKQHQLAVHAVSRRWDKVSALSNPKAYSTLEMSNLRWKSKFAIAWGQQKPVSIIRRCVGTQ